MIVIGDPESSSIQRSLRTENKKKRMLKTLKIVQKCKVDRKTVR